MKFISAVKNIKLNQTKKNTLLSLFGNLLYSILGFCSIAVLARSLSVSDYGSWVIYISASTLFEMMRLGFMHTALVRFSSGSSTNEQHQYIGSGWIIGIIFSLSISVLLLSVKLLLFFLQVNSSYDLFLLYYPVLVLVGLPLSITTSILQFKLQFSNIIKLRLLNMLLSLLIFLFAYYLHFNIHTIIILHIFSNAITSFIAIVTGWSGMRFIKHYTRSKISELIHFGKYSLGTLIGTNLLKSSDTFILALTLGSDSAALYSIPLKLTETFEILLRSIVSVALPKLSSYSIKMQFNEVKKIFQDYSGALTFFYLPLMIGCVLFYDMLLIILGGEKYVQMSQVFQIFCLYGLILPIDRFTGITLDCLNLPKLNFRKVLIMTGFNICFDLIVLHFTSDLKWIAVGSVLTTIIGIFFGITYLNQSFQTNIIHIIKSGFFKIKQLRISFSLPKI